MAGDVPALTAWVIPPRADGAPSWQDHDSGVGDRTLHGVYAGVAVGDCLSGAAAKRGSGAPGARDSPQGWRQSWSATMSLRWNWTTARACWRCRAATTRSNWAARHPHLEL